MAAQDSRSVRVRVAASTRRDGDPTLTVSPQGAGAARLEWLDADHAVLVEGVGIAETRTRVLLGAVRRSAPGIRDIQELVIDGWRIEVELENERRAALRERAQRAGTSLPAGGPLEVRAIIPGRIVALSVGPGDPVTSGQQILVLEAMKMQNELRAPRDGSVERVAAAVGQNVEVGDLLMVIE